jgi:hypothetical protein
MENKTKTTNNQENTNSIFYNPFKFIDLLYTFYKSLIKFLRSSFLSILLLVLVFVLLSNMEQSRTLLVDMLEQNRLDLFFSFLWVAALAILISHYPIYVYYALGINKSKSFVTWKKNAENKKIRFFHFPIFTFIEKGSTYKKNYTVNALRYALGLMVFAIWAYFIIITFKEKIDFINKKGSLKIVLSVVIVIFLIFQYILKIRQKKLADKQKSDKSDTAYYSFHKKIAYGFFISSIASLLLIIMLFLFTNFNQFSFFVLLALTFSFTLNYIFFRLIRTKFPLIHKNLDKKSVLRLFLNPFLKTATSVFYLKIFVSIALLSFLLIIYVNMASVFDWYLPNAIPILLAYAYFIYWSIASLIKYVFVITKHFPNNEKAVKIILALVSILVLFSFLPKEVTIHELDQISINSSSTIKEKDFIKSVKEHKSDTLFFIASHGGGLKANAWTLKVINKLQKQTKGKLLNQTMAFSGASGGSLGLALYTALYKNNANNTDIIDKKIENIVLKGNYTSIDLSMVVGLDAFHKLLPINKWYHIKDRSYYEMRRYQNFIEKEKSNKLSNRGFQEYWGEIFKDKSKNPFFPSLIMNTASTNGKRGILWSVQTDNFKKIFNFSENLADLKINKKDKTLTYYQAISTTNRFPIFSPAAKIKGYGHYMDAGTIDNSGLLSILDLYVYLKSLNALEEKTIVFIEIDSGKSNYIEKVISDYLKDKIRLQEEENETDNILVNVQAGLNLDKIPQYLHSYIKGMSKRDSKIVHVPIILPYKLSVVDIEKHVNGKFSEMEKINLQAYLNKVNHKLSDLKYENSNNWKYYEPTLSRHFSKSSLNYMSKMLENEAISQRILKVTKLVGN